jgi:hypothetical protein
MYQPINSSCDSLRIFKNPLPFGKRQIAGNHQAAALVTIGQQCKQHLHLLAAVLNVSDIIDDNRITASFLLAFKGLLESVTFPTTFAYHHIDV